MSLDAHSKPFSEYREFLAPTPLAARFLCFWSQTIVGSQGAFEHRVLPDGCVSLSLCNTKS
jgi:hypothetical protein